MPSSCEFFCWNWNGFVVQAAGLVSHEEEPFQEAAAVRWRNQALSGAVSDFSCSGFALGSSSVLKVRLTAQARVQRVWKITIGIQWQLTFIWAQTQTTWPPSLLMDARFIQKYFPAPSFVIAQEIKLYAVCTLLYFITSDEQLLLFSVGK